MRIDLHTHSRASDGTQTPADLMTAAARAGLDVIALTDHDTAEGWGEASAAARELGITLVPGMEISTEFEGRAVHLLAYLPDPGYPPLSATLATVLDARNARVPAIVERLTAHGIEITVEDVVAHADGAAAVGRPHVADALVALGVVGHRDQAFAQWLSPGRPGHVHRFSAGLREMIALVEQAGGVSVLAHVWGRHLPETLDEREIAALAELGLGGLEVDHQDHDDATRGRLRALAVDLDLVITGSSDHHGLGKTDHELGCNLTEPEQYQRLLELAADAAARSGRRTPEVVGR
ncbi:PHP domain-containing protein [Nocardioides sp. Bht2]|uniref:PHP domain-containing protein n=1 Tax=Nocardioides sp. Bht2 TaxID=3392297 RepID=UPI0039B61448